MKKYLALILVLITILTLSSCGTNDNDSSQLQEDGLWAPSNHIKDLERLPYPGTWDIPSVRDISISANWSNDDALSVPLYRFDTYEELLHLIEIVDPETHYDNGISPLANGSSSLYDYDYINHKFSLGNDRYYDKEFFENYSLLIGIISGDYRVPSDNYTPDYYRSSDSIIVKIDLEYNDGDYNHLWVYVAVPKEEINNCNSFAMFVSRD